jgi:hypothetical protein
MNGLYNLKTLDRSKIKWKMTISASHRLSFYLSNPIMYLRKKFDIPLGTIAVSTRQITVTVRAPYQYQRRKSVAGYSSAGNF